MQKNSTRIIFSALLLFSVSSMVILFLTFKSFVGMYNFKFRSTSDSPVNSSKEFDEQFTGFPPINASAIPLDAYKGAFLLYEGREKEGLKFLAKSTEVNPYIGYSDFLLGNYYYSLGNIDSATYYGKRAFDLWPKSIDNFDLINKAYAYQGDTISIIKNYAEIKDFFKHRKDEYYESFIKYYSLAKYSYFNVDYSDAESISSNDIIGEWVQVFNRKDRGIRVKINSKIEFLRNGFFKSDNKFYLFDKNGDQISLRFQNNPENIISTLTVKYSKEWQTLIVNFNNSGEDNNKYFRKTSELDLDR
jgi:tetratricopeptide (TPR) repeat protein